MARNDVKTTPTLAETIRAHIDAVLSDTHTTLPGKIVIYNPLTQTADVLPSLMRKYEGNIVPTPLPILPNVPVIHPKTKLAHIHMPLSTGDDVWVLISERSLDRWKLTGILTDPADRRKHSLSDAVCIPGGSGLPFSFSVSDPTAVEVVNGISTVSVGPVKIKASIGVSSATLTPATVDVACSPATGVSLTPVTADVNCGSTKVGLTAAGLISLGKIAPFSVALAEKVLARLIAIELKLNLHIAIYTAHVHDIILPVPATPVTPPLIPDVPLVPIPDPIGSLTTSVQP